MKILFDYSTETGIKECKIIAANEQEEKQLTEVRDKIIEILASATIVVATKEVVESCTDQGDPEEPSVLFTTGGC